MEMNEQAYADLCSPLSRRAIQASATTHCKLRGRLHSRIVSRPELYPPRPQSADAYAGAVRAGLDTRNAVAAAQLDHLVRTGNVQMNQFGQLERIKRHVSWR